MSEENGQLLDKEFCKFYFRTPWAKLFRRDIIVRCGHRFDTINFVLFQYVGYCYKVDFYEQASKHAMNAVGVYQHLDAILRTKGLRLLRERIHYDFPQIKQMLKIYFRRLFLIYLTEKVTTYKKFREEIKAFNKLKIL